MDIIAATGISNVLNYTWWIAEFIIGLGLVVFVHELGHFLVAKFVDIKVERFALGFGPRLVGFQRGETDYCINVIPLGGYVKMLGQEDFKPESGELPDPRAFTSKSVGARFAVVSAGVIMNVIFAAVAFVIVSMVGMKAPAPVIGMVMPGSPASKAEITWAQPLPADATGATTSAVSPASAPSGDKSIGLQGGDKILRVQGTGIFSRLVSDQVEDFQKLMYSSLLASPDDHFVFKIERTIDGKTYTGEAHLGVRTLMPGALEKSGFGLTPASTTTVGASEDYVTSGPFVKDDKVVAFNGKPVEFLWQINQIQDAQQAAHDEFTIQRDGNKLVVTLPAQLFYKDAPIQLRDGTWVLAETVDLKDGNVRALLHDGNSLTFPAAEIADGSRRVDGNTLTGGDLSILGMSPRTMVASVSLGSPAEAAGIKPGDIFYKFSDVANPPVMKLIDITRALDANGAQMVIERDGNLLPLARIVPKSRDSVLQMGIGPVPDQEHAIVAEGVKPGSLAAKAGIMSGDVLEKINDKPVKTWVDVYLALKYLLGKNVTIQYRRGEQTLTADIGVLDDKAFVPQAYTLEAPLGHMPWDTLQVTINQRNPIKAIGWGVTKTWEFVLMQYGTLRQLAAGRVGGGDISGPIGIGGMAISFARRGPIEMLYFMAFISAALAVINFLPFPVVDGGLAAFLIIEKFRGRPLPPKVTWIIQLIGLVILGGVFILLTWNDIMHIVRGMW